MYSIIWFITIIYSYILFRSIKRTFVEIRKVYKLIEPIRYYKGG